MVHTAFDMGLIFESAGRGDMVAKLMPNLLVTKEDLLAGLNIFKNAVIKVLAEQ